MVKGVASLRAKFNRVPNLVVEEISAALEKSADEIVADMNSLKPIPEIVIAWTWGEVPKGALRIGQVRGKDYGRISITIYAKGVTADYGDFAAIAGWFEFGTADRYQKSGRYTGRIPAQPYFFPAFRSNKTRIKGRITRALKKGLARAN